LKVHLDGVQLRRIEGQIENALRGRKVNSMVNLQDVSRSAIEARLEYLINQRTQAGETRQFAEVQVTRTDEGRALWSRARKLRMAENADSASNSTFSHTAASLTVHQAKLENMIAQRMSECSETCDVAERAVIHTSDGLDLWEKVRALKLAESRVED
jgi:hypothetical protein